MESIVKDQYLQDAVAVGSVEAEQMHRGIVHAHHQLDVCSLLGHQEVAMRGYLLAKRGGAQVEVASFVIIVQIRIKPQESAEVHQEYQMKVGKLCLTLVQPFNAVANIVKQRLVVLFVPQCMVEKFVDEQADGVVLKYVSPVPTANNSGERILTAIPSINDLFTALSQKVAVTPAISNFNLSTVKLAMVNDNNTWFNVTWY